MSTKPDPMKKLTERQRLQLRFFHDLTAQFEYDLRWHIWEGNILPTEWKETLREEPVAGKTRVTIRLDEDLVRFFRKMGPGWQSKLNTVVRAYVKARLSAIMEKGGELETAADYALERPKVGDAERVLEWRSGE